MLELKGDQKSKTNEFKNLSKILKRLLVGESL
jgi:hypothetical protein